MTVAVARMVTELVQFVIGSFQTLERERGREREREREREKERKREEGGGDGERNRGVREREREREKETVEGEMERERESIISRNCNDSCFKQWHCCVCVFLVTSEGPSGV